MTKIREISTSTVKAATGSDLSTTIHLTPWDLQLLLVNYIQKGLLYDNKPENFPSFLDHLKNSLSRTLDFFPPLIGRLAAIKNDDDTQSFIIDCNNAGAQFTHAIADELYVKDIGSQKYVPEIVRDFFPLNGVLNIHGISKPLLGVQVTELEDGYFIGFSLNHSIVDGNSFWNFINSWSEISRGFDSPSKVPSFEREQEIFASLPVHIRPIVEQVFEKSTPTPLVERVFHFSKESIGLLKKKAKCDPTTGGEVSSLQAVLAHIWLSEIRCREYSGNDDVSLKLLVSARQRLLPPLPDGYFGNTVHLLTVTTTPSQLLSRGFGWAAGRLNEAVAAQTREETKRSYEDWIKEPRILILGLTTRNSLVISSSPRFDVYGNDLGWGKPVAVRSGSGNKFDGKVTVFTGPDPGSIDIQICLSNHTLQLMEMDKEFMAFVPV